MKDSNAKDASAQDTTAWGDLETATRTLIDIAERPDLRVVGLTILAHPDLRRVGERTTMLGLTSGTSVDLSRLEPEFSAPRSGRKHPLADPHLSRRPLRFESSDGGVRVITEGTRTRVTVHGTPVDGSRAFEDTDLEQGVVMVLAERIALLLHWVDPAPPIDMPDFGLVGESAEIVALRQHIARVADLGVVALLRGETGTGKELVANAIHGTSPRRGKPFVAVNMGAIPPSLAAAELFGAAKGAFTGAERHRRGHFTRADGGTLFLDEIGETPPEVQVLLLRALETGEVVPVGSSTPQRPDVRILAATDADLEAEIAANRFRAPLLHRLSGYEIRLPPLRQRREDIPRLLIHFLEEELKAMGEGWRLEQRSLLRPWLPASLVARLVAYDWPGNVRQLRNVARQLVIGNRGVDQLRLPPELEEQLATSSKDEGPPAEIADDVPTSKELANLETADLTEAAKSSAAGMAKASATEAPSESEPVATDTGPAKRPVYRSPDEVGEDELLEALRTCRFKLQPCAALLGISRTSLYALIDRSPNIRKARDLTLDEIESSHRMHNGDMEAMAMALQVSRSGLRRRMTELGFR